MEIREFQTVVVDIGSCVFKCGYSGGSRPQFAFDDSLGVSKYPYIAESKQSQKDFYISSEANWRTGVLNFKHPAKKGVIEDWDNMQKILHESLYNQMRIEPQAHPFIFTHSLAAPNEQNERLAEIMFETYNIPGICFQPVDKLTLLSCGRKTGVVVECGDQVTSISAIFEGFRIPQATRITHVSGNSVTEYIMNILSQNPDREKGETDYNLAREIKKVCYIAYDYKREVEAQKFNKRILEYTLPDGSKLNINDESFKAPEFLFRPHIFGVEGKGIHTLLAESVTSCDCFIQPRLLKNICLGGGSTLFKGFDARMEKEAKDILGPTVHSKVYATPQRGFAAWYGAAIFSAQQTFIYDLVTREQYNNEGKSLISTKWK